MNATEAGKILSFLQTIDRREVNALAAQGWAIALHDIPYERGLQAARLAVEAGTGYVDQMAIRRQLNVLRPQLERDVRSAKARGLIAATWDPRTPLTGELEQQLRQAQAAEYAANNDAAEDVLAASAPRPEINA